MANPVVPATSSAPTQNQFNGFSRGIYSPDYFCLTDNNYLLARRNGKILQIKPSEFLENDELQTIDENGQLLWQRAVCTPSSLQEGEEIVQLNTRAGLIEVTTGHKLFLENKELIAAGNIQEQDSLWEIENNLLETTSPIGIGLAYALGAYSAEGSHQEGSGKLQTGKWRIEYALHLNEDIFAARIVQSLLTLGNKIPINPIVKKYPQYTRTIVGIYSKELVLYFKELGATGLASQKRIPSCIFSSSKEEKAAYIAGLFEGDGGATNRCLRVKLTSKALIDGLKILLSTFGINSKLLFRKSTEINCQDQYILSIYGKENLTKFVCIIGKYLPGWKHLLHIKEYGKSDNKNIKHTKSEIKKIIKENYPISADKFCPKTKISQAVVKRLFGSWNQAIKECGLIPKNSRWGRDYKKQVLVQNFDIDLSCKVHQKKIIKSDKTIVVYDFTIPKYEKFLIGNLVSHNSDSQCAIYFGGIYIDEITSIGFEVSHQKMPLYGYADKYFRGISKGQVLVQGMFTINFKEAGYIWLALNEYHSQLGKKTPLNPFIDSDDVLRQNVERIVEHNNLSDEEFTKKRNEAINTMAGFWSKENAYDSLAGYPGGGRGPDPKKSLGFAENIFESFEDAIWSSKTGKYIPADELDRDAANPELNNFDIYLAYGDFIGDNRLNHTIRKISSVHITSWGQQIGVDGQNIQEIYRWVARSAV
jgi:hypothetical protein